MIRTRRMPATEGHPTIPFIESAPDQAVVTPPLAPAFEPLPERSDDEGARGGFTGNTGAPFRLDEVLPPEGTPERAAFDEGVVRARAALTRGSSVGSFDPDSLQGRERGLTDAKKPDWIIREEQVRKDLGFFPTSSSETSKAIGISHQASADNPTGAYLVNIINTRLESGAHANIAKRAAHAVVGEIGSYVTGAKGAFDRLQELAFVLSDIPTDVHVDEITEDLDVPAIVDVLQHKQLREAMMDGEGHHPGNRREPVAKRGGRVVLAQEIDGLGEQSAQSDQQRAITELAPLSVRELLQVIDEATHSQEIRAQYWLSRLEQAAQNPLTRVSASRILESLSAVDPA